MQNEIYGERYYKIHICRTNNATINKFDLLRKHNENNSKTLNIFYQIILSVLLY